MKKIIMMAVMAVAAVSANAQMWVGGNLGINTQTTKFEDTELSSGTNFEIAPEVGYNLNEKWAVAMAVSYAHNENCTISFAGKSVTGNVNSFSIKPFVRYTFLKSGNFSAFCDGVLYYTTYHAQGIENNLNDSGVSLNPGIAYAVSPKVSLVAHLGKLGYNHTWFDTDFGTAKMDKFDFNVSNSVYFGAIVNL